MGDPVKVAIVQRPPVLLDREATLKNAVAYLHEAADEGAKLAVFPEAYVPGYPAWIWGLRPGPDYGRSAELHAALIHAAVDIGAGDLQPLQDAAAEREMTVVCGVHDRDGDFSRGTLYNTLVTIGPDGSILNRHRKLMPTNPERMVWGMGNARGLRVVDTPVGRLGSVICWENYMPLVRYALYAEGVEVYAAPTWDWGDTWLATCRHIAAEGRCWVLNAGCSMKVEDVPADFPGRDELWPDGGWINPGDSMIVRPNGQIVAGPLHEEHGILYADIEPARSGEDHRTMDVAGHYGRNDIFQLTIDRSPKSPITFND